MRMFAILTRLELKRVLAGRAAPLGLALFLLAGAYGLYHGKTMIDRQRAVLAASPVLQQEQADYLARIYPADQTEAGSLLYYRFFHTHHEPTAWSAASLGLRDVNPFNLKVRLLTLQGQLYDSELANPASQAAGNLDLAFVLVFLLPLLIIALTYNVLSSEEEQDTWRLLWAQPVAVARVFALKLGVRLGVVLLVCALLFLATVAYLGVPLDARLAVAATLILAYVLFWFAAALLVVSLRRSSDFNALALVGAWLGLTILVPALLNVAASTRLPVPEALEVIVRQRQGYHESWDLSKGETMESFYRRYPEMAVYPVPEERFSWGWYYAMNQRGDDAAEGIAALYRERLEEREQWIRRAALWVPPLGVQLALNRIAGTDLANHLAYLDSVREYHEALERALYPVVLREGMADEVNWAGLPRHRLSGEGTTIPPLSELGILFALTAGLATLGFLRLARIRVEPRERARVRRVIAATR
jgi:ABC-2 type transport system permease protein